MGVQLRQGGDRDRTSNSPVSGETLRQCALTRNKLPRHELLRFVLDPDGVVTPDIYCRLPGRGVWITGNSEILGEAVAKKVFAARFKQRVKTNEDLAGLTGRLLKRAVRDALSMANKSGLIVTGFARLERAILRGQIISLVHASDGAKDGRVKLDRKLRGNPAGRGLSASRGQNDEDQTGESPDSGIICAKKRIDSVRLLTCEELSLALGRANVIHAGLKAGGMADKFLQSARRYGKFCKSAKQNEVAIRAAQHTDEV